jgi:hypothetical protein
MVALNRNFLEVFVLRLVTRYVVFMGFFTMNMDFAFAEKPSVAPSNQVVDKWSYSLAIQAASWGAPLVIMYALRSNIAFGPYAKSFSEYSLAYGKHFYSSSVRRSWLCNT